MSSIHHARGAREHGCLDVIVGDADSTPETHRNSQRLKQMVCAEQNIPGYFYKCIWEEREAKIFTGYINFSAIKKTFCIKLHDVEVLLVRSQPQHNFVKTKL